MEHIDFFMSDVLWIGCLQLDLHHRVSQNLHHPLMVVWRFKDVSYFCSNKDVGQFEAVCGFGFYADIMG